jgi:GNAT superfamily N-acetyltransferase
MLIGGLIGVWTRLRSPKSATMATGTREHPSLASTVQLQWTRWEPRVGANMGDKSVDQRAITAVPATPERWADIEALFAGTPCWCQYWRVSAGEYGRGSTGKLHEGRLAKRRDALRKQLERRPPPGMLAYIAGRVVGWCGFGPRQTMERLVRSRTIPAVDDRPVWAIVCFLVRVGYRRRGVAQTLLEGTIAYARAQGAEALEAYPVDPGGKRIDGTFAYVGTLPMFERAGFRRVIETSARSAGLPRWLMRLEFAASEGECDSDDGGTNT